MNCRQARIDLALCVGEDLPDAARRESLKQHVAQCPGCRAHYKRLRGTLRVLESSDRDRTYDVGGSLWPQVSHRIRRLEEAPQLASRFNGWLPFVAVTAACAMLIVAMDIQGPAPVQPHGLRPYARDMFSGSSLLPEVSPVESRNLFLPTGADRHRHSGVEPRDRLDHFSTETTRFDHAEAIPAATHNE